MHAPDGKERQFKITAIPLMASQATALFSDDADFPIWRIALVRAISSRHECHPLVRVSCPVSARTIGFNRRLAHSYILAIRATLPLFLPQLGGCLDR